MAMIDGIPTLADALAGRTLDGGSSERTNGRVHRLSNRPAARPPMAAPPQPTVRVHRIEDDEEQDTPRPSRSEPLITPFIAFAAKGELIHSRGEINLPRGRPRKTATAVEGATPTETTKKTRRGPKPGSKRAAKPHVQPGDARFLVDDRGGMEIRDGQQVIQLEGRDVARLTELLARVKGMSK